VNHTTLEAKKGNQITLRLVSEETGKPQALKLPGMPADVKAQILSLSSESNGTLKANLAKLSPIKGEVVVKTASKLKVTNTKQKKSNEVVTDMSLRVEMSGK
jgi:hypothetical protein